MPYVVLIDGREIGLGLFLIQDDNGKAEIYESVEHAEYELMGHISWSLPKKLVDITNINPVKLTVVK